MTVPCLAETIQLGQARLLDLLTQGPRRSPLTDPSSDMLAAHSSPCARTCGAVASFPNKSFRPRNASAFTLIELMIVMALMVIMYVMLFSFSSGTHQRTQKELCAGNLQKVYLAMQIYGIDYGVYPRNTNAETSEQVLSPLVPKYSADTSIFICPGGRDPAIPTGAPLDQHKISYAYYMGRGTNAAEGDFMMSDRQINTLSKNMGDPVFSPNGRGPGNNHHKYGGNVLFSDGSVQDSPPNATFSLAFSNGIVLLNPKP